MGAKYAKFAILLVLCIGLDQWTKQIASARLATTQSWIDHPMLLRVGPAHDGRTVEEFLRAELTHNKPKEVSQIARRYTRTADGSALTPETVLRAGDAVEITQRKIVVIPRYFDFEYTRNPGAAFGVLADTDSPWRTPFFIVVSVLAIIVIGMMLRGVEHRDHLSVFALGFVAGGAIGNFIDRVSYGWVVDFIVWKVGDDYRWPTFNVADAFISVGVALLVVGMLRDWRRDRAEAAPMVEEA